MLNKFLFTKIEEDIGNIWLKQDDATCHTTAATLDVLRPVCEDRIISRRADVVWPTRSCDLTALVYYFWGAVKDKCYADKLEIIDTIDNVLKNWTDRVGYCKASRGSYLNEIIFYY